jgi:hypothetical protein
MESPRKTMRSFFLSGSPAQAAVLKTTRRKRWLMMASVFIWWACEINTQVVRWLISSFLGRPCFQGILGVLFFATIFLEPAGVADEEVVFIDELDEVVGGSSWEGCR